MAWYFNMQTLGFMTTVICGERTLQIPDPDWKPDPHSEEIDPQHPLITVDNPACTLAPEALLWPLTDEDYAALFAGQGAGKVISTTAQGHPILTDRPALTPEQIQMQQAADQAQRLTAANAHKATLAERIATLTDAVDNIGQPGVEAFAATPEEQDELARHQRALVQWKNYTIALSRVVPTAEPVQWPPKPESF